LPSDGRRDLRHPGPGTFHAGLFERAATRFARCLRAHGFPDFPLPRFEGGDAYDALQDLPFDWTSSRFTAAVAACETPIQEYVMAGLNG
jgi:hypothetical protein